MMRLTLATRQKIRAILQRLNCLPRVKRLRDSIFVSFAPYENATLLNDAKKYTTLKTGRATHRWLRFIICLFLFPSLFYRRVGGGLSSLQCLKGSNLLVAHPGVIYSRSATPSLLHAARLRAPLWQGRLRIEQPPPPFNP